MKKKDSGTLKRINGISNKEFISWTILIISIIATLYFVRYIAMNMKNELGLTKSDNDRFHNKTVDQLLDYIPYKHTFYLYYKEYSSFDFKYHLNNEKIKKVCVLTISVEVLNPDSIYPDSSRQKFWVKSFKDFKIKKLYSYCDPAP